MALDNLGGRCVFASEIEPHAAAVYTHNFGDVNPDPDSNNLHDANPTLTLLSPTPIYILSQP